MLLRCSQPIYAARRHGFRRPHQHLLRASNNSALNSCGGDFNAIHVNWACANFNSERQKLREVAEHLNLENDFIASKRILSTFVRDQSRDVSRGAGPNDGFLDYTIVIWERMTNVDRICFDAIKFIQDFPVPQHHNTMTTREIKSIESNVSRRRWRGRLCRVAAHKTRSLSTKDATNGKSSRKSEDGHLRKNQIWLATIRTCWFQRMKSWDHE